MTESKEADLNRRYLLKYATDKILALLLLCIFSPLILCILFAIWIEGLLCKDSRGPAIYKETRISQGRPFTMFKFRVLKTSVIEKMTELDSATFLQEDKKNTTNVGKVLIKFYLDELPQLLNILKGEMSIVGPRPRIPVIYEENLKQGYSALKFLKGGITGPHQLSKGAFDFSGAPRESEEYYDKCKSYGAFKLLIYDTGIMLKTSLKILKAEGL